MHYAQGLTLNSTPLTPNLTEIINEFFIQQGLIIQNIKIKESLTKIIKECQLGLEGGESSLPMLNTHTSRKINFSPLSDKDNILKLVIDAGGTNFRVVVVRFQGKQHELVYYEKNPMPGSKGEISIQDFFKQVVSYLKPVLDNLEHFKKFDPHFTHFDSIQFCFSYPTKMDDTGEGYVYNLTKEIDIKGIVGKPLGKHLLAALQEEGYNQIKKVVILNDTTATLLAGCYAKLIDDELGNYDGMMGIVWGTGFNIAYEENQFFDRQLIVNSEAGNYNHFHMNDLDNLIDSSSLQPGKGLTEKKISGYYFGPMCKTLLSMFVKFLQNEKNNLSIFSEQFRKIILDPQIELRSDHISQFLLMNKSSEAPKLFFKREGIDAYEVITWNDHKYLQSFINQISYRSAYLTALISTGLMMRSMGIDINAPKCVGNSKRFCIVLDGSMIRKMPGLQKLFKDYLSKLCEPYGLSFDTMEIDKAPIIGTALADFDLNTTAKTST